MSRILVVEDSESKRYVTVRMLRAAGYDVIEATTGKEALDKLQMGPDVIVLDLKLPDTDGFTLTKTIKSHPHYKIIPIVHHSAHYSTEENKAQGLECGADAYLTCPVTSNVLVATIKSMLRLRYGEVELQKAIQERDRFFVLSMDMMAVLSSEGVILRANPSFEKNLEFTHSELIGQNISNFSDSSDKEKTLSEFKKLADGKPSIDFEARFRSKSGEIRWLSWRVAPVLEENLVYAVTRDITAQKQFESEMKRAKLVAEEANQAKSNFLATISHEIRTPLGAILGFTDLLKNQSLNLSEQVQYIDVINRNGKALTRIIDDILDLTKVEAGHLDIENLSFEIEPLIQEVIELLTDSARRKGISLLSEVDKSVPSNICTDVVRVRQILMNVLGNAIKFTDQGTVVLKVTAKNNKISFQVTDSGIGMSEKEQERLFQPFSQADSSTTRRFGGTGLGLVLSRQLARALGGDLVLEKSLPGEGSTFVATVATKEITLPQNEIKKPQAKERTLNPFGLTLKGKKILLVEDAPDNQLLLQRLLNKYGVEITTLDNGAEAVRGAFNDDFDVVLMDVQMPVMDGISATRILREKGFKKPIIALTAFAMKSDRDRCLEVGCTDYLTKPVHFPSLLEKLSRHVGH